LNTYQKSLDCFPIKQILSPSEGWKKEVFMQIESIKRISNSSHVILILDDFVFSYCDTFEVSYLFNNAITNKISYFLFRAPPVSILKKISFIFTNKNRIIDKNYRYYSSLQVAVWDIDYFLSVLEKVDDIWSFECQESSERHYYTVKKYMKYHHVVEKGKWDMLRSNWILKNCGFFTPGSRAIFERGVLIFYIRRIKRFFTGV
jgi:hypothetical protein